LPGLLSAHIRPPMRSTASRAIARQTGAGLSLSMLESMKYLEYPVMILHIKTDLVIFHSYDKLFFGRITTNRNHGSRYIAGKFEGVLVPAVL
jgi:hypothetical protein